MINIHVMVILLLSFKQSFGIEVNITKKFPKSIGTLYSVQFDRKLHMTIPDECANLDFCEEIPDFPEDEISKLINLLIADKMTFNQDREATFDEHMDAGRAINLCRSRLTFIQPKAVKVGNEWHLVLNSESNMVQSFRGEICMDAQNAPCSSLVNFNRGFTGHCVQKYMETRMIVLSKNYDEVIALPQSVPSCCSCMAFQL
ncbi:uncharacterized protein LOC110995328 [Pieris rapae]|uniref:Spaetzle domain-containing protein n=1 Tax=Pieris rapae TaxID=64459 RepID=A0A220K8Q5_PIERA|nr:uncharacterized protein LOC110995328 [Pieris rapae]ASJ26457.1 hypothetical protein [Pieris rapae]